MATTRGGGGHSYLRVTYMCRRNLRTRILVVAKPYKKEIFKKIIYVKITFFVQYYGYFPQILANVGSTLCPG